MVKTPNPNLAAPLPLSCADFFVVELVFDLFGEAVCLPRGGKGRPSHVWTQENSNKISLLFACGHDVKTAAAAIGVSVPTLYKHYFNECEKRRMAGVKLTAVQLDRLNKQAEAGNVAAEKALAALVQAEKVKLAGPQLIGRRSEAKGKSSVPLGKKETAKQAALTLEGRFARRTPPSSLMN